MLALRRFALILAALVFAAPVLAEDAKETPQQAFEAFKKEVVAKNPEAVWNMWSDAMKKRLVDELMTRFGEFTGDKENMESLAQSTGKSVEELKALKPAEFAKIMVVGLKVGWPEHIEKTDWVSADIKVGRVALCKLILRMDSEAEIQEILLLENGRWKIDDKPDEAFPDPKQAFEDFKAAAKAKDVDGVWNFFSAGSHKFLLDALLPTVDETRNDADRMEKLAKQTGLTVEALKKLKPEEFVKRMVVADETEDPDHIGKVEWVGSDAGEGDELIFTTNDSKTGEEEKRVMLLEGGKWRFDIEASEKLKGK